MGFREKVAWASLAAHLVVFGWYFANFAGDWRTRIASDDHGLGQMAGAIVLLLASRAFAEPCAISGNASASARCGRQ